MPTASAAHPALALAVAGLLAATALGGCASLSCDPGRLRLGYFPNLTHAQPLYGVHTGLYQEALGDVRLEAFTFNAGPNAYEALLSASVDAIYVGPSPTLNALEKTGTEVVRIVAGSATGGASLVVRPGVDVGEGADLAGKRFATPQLGNTQDVALKHWLLGRGHRSEDQGGDVEVRNAQNADILAMFQRGQVDGAWVPEPWATRLVLEGQGVVAVDEADLWPGKRFVTTHLVVRRVCVEQAPEAVQRLLAAHLAATATLRQADDATLRALNDATEAATRQRLADETLRVAFGRITFDSDPLPQAMDELANRTLSLGFLRQKPDVRAAFHLEPLAAAQGAGATP
jgi:NitT/TauT family transport system substrate-binding protein